MGDLTGWRSALFSVVPLALAAALWQSFARPRLPVDRPGRSGSTLGLLGGGRVRLGMTAILLVLMGQLALSTYLRPFLEQVTGVGVPTLSHRRRRGQPRLPPGRSCSAGEPALDTGRRALGDGRGCRRLGPVGTLDLGCRGTACHMGPCGPGSAGGLGDLAHAHAAEVAEAGGGLMVAVIRLAITLGAAVRGVVLDAAGPLIAFSGSAALLTLATTAAVLASRATPRSRRSRSEIR